MVRLSVIGILLLNWLYANSQLIYQATSIGGDSYDYANAIQVAPNGDIIIAGAFMDTVDFDPGVNQEIRTSIGIEDIFVLCLDSTFQFKWVRQFGGSGNDRALDIDIDNLGNIYVTGYFQSDLIYPPGTTQTILSSAGGIDVFIIKISPLGAFQYAKSIGGTGGEKGNALNLDNSGHLYVSGSFSLTADFDPSSNVYPLTSNGNSDAFLVKLDTSGQFQWAKSWGGSSQYGDAIYDNLVMNADTSLILAGIFGGVVDFDSSPQSDQRTAVGDQDMFITCLGLDGTYKWTKTFGSTGPDGIVALANINNLICASGFFSNTLSLSSSVNINAVGSGDGLLLTLNKQGIVKWHSHFGSTGDERIMDVSVAPNNEYLIASGFYTTNLDLNPGAGTFQVQSAGLRDVFHVQLDSTGSFLFGDSYGGTNNDGVGKAFAKNSTFYTVGNFQNSISINVSGSPTAFSSEGSTDILIQKYVPPGFNINQPKSSKALKVFPNPTDNGKIYIDGINKSLIQNMSLFDARGTEVLIDIDYLENSALINIDGPPGIYYLQIEMRGFKIYERIVKTR